MKAEQIRSGQSRPYADSIYEWHVIAENGESEQQVLDWCKTNLKNAHYEHEEWCQKQHHNIGVHFAGYYELLNKGYNNYDYKVVEPFCG